MGGGIRRSVIRTFREARRLLPISVYELDGMLYERAGCITSDRAGFCGEIVELSGERIAARYDEVRVWLVRPETCRWYYVYLEDAVIEDREGDLVLVSYAGVSDIGGPLYMPEWCRKMGLHAASGAGEPKPKIFLALISQDCRQQHPANPT